MNSYIKIIRKPYEEPHQLNLLIDASNGVQRAQLEFYDIRLSLIKVADRLENFPRHRDDVFVWELGSERPEDRWGFYFRFRAFTLDSIGHGAIQLRFNNNSPLPYREISEFCIQAVSADFNRLGQLFREFSKLEHKTLEWTVTEGHLDK
jgi:hypothetical protein